VNPFTSCIKHISSLNAIILYNVFASFRTIKQLKTRNVIMHILKHLHFFLRFSLCKFFRKAGINYNASCNLRQCMSAPRVTWPRQLWAPYLSGTQLWSPTCWLLWGLTTSEPWISVSHFYWCQCYPALWPSSYVSYTNPKLYSSENTTRRSITIFLRILDIYFSPY